MDALILWCRAWIARRKQASTVQEKRRLERLLLDEGLSHSKARRVVALFFSTRGTNV